MLENLACSDARLALRFKARRFKHRARRFKRFNRYCGPICGWSDACINRFDRGLQGLVGIVVNLCVVRKIEFLRNSKLFQSFLPSLRFPRFDQGLQGLVSIVENLLVV